MNIFFEIYIKIKILNILEIYIVHIMREKNIIMENLLNN